MIFWNKIWTNKQTKKTNSHRFSSFIHVIRELSGSLLLSLSHLSPSYTQTDRQTGIESVHSSQLPSFSFFIIDFWKLQFDLRIIQFSHSIKKKKKHSPIQNDTQWNSSSMVKWMNGIHNQSFHSTTQCGYDENFFNHFPHFKSKVFFFFALFIESFRILPLLLLLQSERERV